MTKGLLKKILPHLIALIIFLLVAVIYCSPALEGMVVNQSDITNWKGSIQQSMEYKEIHGQYPLWTNSLFGGMPAFQIGYSGNNYVPWIAHQIFTLGLPEPIQFFFLASICFYFLCICLRVNPYVGIVGGLAFAYATYNPVIISVGHNTKMWCIAYMPALLGSVLLVFNRKYWLGAGLTALFSSVMIAMNHVQIAYYLFLVIFIMAVFHAVWWIRHKEWKHLAMAVAFSLGGVLIGVLSNAVTLLSTYEYQKETIRGGYSELSPPAAGDAKTGLKKDYVFEYSMGIAEPLVMMVPRMYGGSSDHAEVAQDKSKAVEGFGTLQQNIYQYFLSKQVPQQQAQQETERITQQIPFSYYWGDIGGVGTSGPPYVGAIVCFLAILGMFVLGNRHKWWILTAIVLTIVMSWGGHFEAFNKILYDHLPFYNKFRAPTIILVIPQLLLGLLAVLTIDKFIRTEDRKSLIPAFKKGLIATGVTFLVLFLMYLTMDFQSDTDSEFLKSIRQQGADLYPFFNNFFNSLAEDRKSLMIGDIFRSLGFIAVTAFLLFLLIRNTIRPWLLIGALGLLTLLDLIPIASIYLNKEDYQDKMQNESAFQLTPSDHAILADKGHYRVFNFSGNAYTENITSYHYNSIGGYHPAKLRIYNDLIDSVLRRQQPNMQVLNMLNTKYFIQRDRSGLTGAYQRNDSALGPVWFVDSIRFVKDARAEMAALDAFDPKTTAIVQESFKADIPFMPQADSGHIQMVKNDNDIITYTSNVSTNQFAVFSEIFYDAGWKAFIDGKEAPIVKVNYVLRGLAVPAGRHSIEFRFEPQGFYRGKSLTTIFSVLLLILLAAGFFMEWRYRKRKAPVAQKA